MADTSTRLNSTTYDVDAVRRDFPILSEKVYGKPLVFLDSGRQRAEAASGHRRHVRLHAT